MRRLGAYAQPAIVADVDALQLNRPSRNDYPCARICGDGTFGHQKVRVGGSDAELAAVLKRDPAEEHSGRTGNDNALGPGLGVLAATASGRDGSTTRKKFGSNEILHPSSALEKLQSQKVFG